MKNELYKYLLVFFASLGLAFWASMPKSSKETGRIAVRSVNTSLISTVEFTSPELKVLIQINENKKWWVTTQKGQNKEEFLASAKIQEVFSRWTPLEAIRVIGTLKADDEKSLAEYGLKDATKTVVVKDAKDQVLLSLQIGKQAFGSRNVFAMDVTDRKLVLIAGEFLADLEHPETKLYERTMTQVVFEEIQAATIKYQGKAKKLLHTKRDEKQMLLWTHDSADQKTNVAAKSWFERLDRVRIVSFATKEELAAVESATPFFSVELDSPNAKDQLEFVKLSGKAAQAANGAHSAEYFVKSNFLGMWAKVASTRLEPIEKDLPSVLGD